MRRRLTNRASAQRVQQRAQSVLQSARQQVRAPSAHWPPPERPVCAITDAQEQQGSDNHAMKHLAGEHGW